MGQGAGGRSNCRITADAVLPFSKWEDAERAVAWRRLANLGLLSKEFGGVEEVVRWLGAVERYGRFLELPTALELVQ